MKTVSVLLSVFVLSCSLIAQPEFKKQISFLDFDARNPSFVQTNAFVFDLPLFPQRNHLLFEGYKDPTHSQIFTLKYDLEKDSFYAPTQITFSKGSCINPSGVFAPIGNISEMDRIIWQTNENGNWDIAYGELFGDTLRNVRYIAHDSLLDEINPRLVFPNYIDQPVFGLTYEKAGSVYLYYEIYTFKVTEKIFDATYVDSYEYGHVAAAVSLRYRMQNIIGIVAAEKKFQNGEKKIVYKMNGYDSLGWSEEKYLYDSTTITTSPNFTTGLHVGELLTFEANELGKKRLKGYFNMDDYGKPASALPISDSSYEAFNFSMMLVPQVTRSLKKSHFGYGQSIYQIRKENNNFLLPDYYNPVGRMSDSLVAIKMDEPKITTEVVKWANGWYYIYSVWEDSCDNGTVNLFGSSGLYTVGGIENETSPQDFTLYQNYPNPFNPETVISFQLSVRSNVTLKIFDVLGREVATLVNQEKPAGEYQILFNNQLTTNHQLLSSGVLFYQLKVGNRLQTKSMLLLK